MFNAVLPRTALLILFLLSPLSGWGQETITLAIFQFRPENIDAMGYESDVMLAIRNEISGRPSIRLLARRDVEETLSRKDLEQSFSVKNAIIAGRLLSVRYVLIGSVSKRDGEINALMKLVDISAGMEVEYWTASYRTRNEIDKASEDLVNQIVAATKGDYTSVSREYTAGSIRESSTAAESQHGVEPISSFRADAKRSLIELRWEPAIGREVLGYNIYRARTVGGPYSFLDTANTPRYTDDTVQPGTTYYYQLGEVDLEGLENRSHKTVKGALEKSAVVSRAVPVPLIYTVTPLAGGARLELLPSMKSATPQVIKLRVYRRGMGDNWEEIAEVPLLHQSAQGSTRSETKKITFIDKALPTGVGQFQYAVSALTDKGEESPLSKPFDHSVAAIAELFIGDNKQLRRVELNWQPAEAGTGYRVYRRKPGGRWELIGELKKRNKTNFVDQTKLVDGKQYEYYYTAIDEESESHKSNIVITRTKPPLDAPLEFLAKSGLAGRVDLNWQPVEDDDAVAYIIYRADYTDEEKFDISPIAEVEGRRANSFTDAGEAPNTIGDGQRYHYAIATKNRLGGIGPISPAADVETKHRPPDINDPDASTEAGNITLTWQYGLGDVSQFRIERRWRGGNWEALATIEPTERTFVDSQLRPYASADYRVTVVDTTQLVSNATLMENVQSPVVVELSLAADSLLRRAELSWNPQLLIDAYVLRRRRLPDGEWRTIDATIAADATSFTDNSGLHDGTQYLYVLSPLVGKNELGESNTVQTTTRIVAAPGEFEASRGVARQISLTWPPTDDPNVAGYSIYRGEGSLEAEQLALYAELDKATANEFIDRGSKQASLQHGVDYSYAIAAKISLGGEGPRSEAVQGNSKPTPEPVYNLVAFSEDGEIKISWDYEARDNVSEFQVSRRWQGEKWKPLISMAADKSEHIDQELKPYAEVEYKLVVKDVDELFSNNAVSEAFTSPARIDLEVTRDQLLREVHLGWNEQDLVTGYAVERRPFGDAGWKKLKTIRNRSTTEYVDKKGLVDGTDYEYRLSALEKRKVLGVSNKVQAHTKDLPPAPADVIAESGQPGQVRVSWTVIEDEDIGGYTIYRVGEAGAKKIASIRGAGKSEYLDKGGVFDTLESETEYSYIVAAYNRYRVEGARSDVVSAVTATLASGNQ